MSEKIEAADIGEASSTPSAKPHLEPSAESPGPEQPENHAADPSAEKLSGKKAADTTKQVKEIYRQTASQVMDEIRRTDFLDEIVPVDRRNVHPLLRDGGFWVVMTLGVLPLFITSFNSSEMQLTGLLFFFAMLWGGVFRHFVIKTGGGLRWPVAAFFFTGLVGIYVLLTFYKILPNFYLELTESPHAVTRLFGSIFQTGLCEELCKLAPVVAYLLIKRRKAVPELALLIGVFSGLGFAAFENIQYSERASINAFMGAVENYGYHKSVARWASDSRAGTMAAMTNVMLRSLSLVFAHAVFSGISSYFVVTAYVTRSRWIVLCALGLAVPAVLHGTYNWLSGLQPVFAALIVAVAFLLFYGYLSKLRQRLTDDGQTVPEASVEKGNA